jgi:WhiB family redox-sensing transcriptional regulator
MIGFELDWRDKAACRGYDPEDWFPAAEEGSRAYDRQVAAAKSICHACPVAADCLQHALAHGEDAGIWGGLSEQERRDLRLGLGLSYTPSSA